MSTEGLSLRTGFLGRTVIPWDELAIVEDTRVRLRTGGSYPVTPALAARAREVLQGPAVTGLPACDAQALERYLGGSWAPERTALALLEMATRCGASDIHFEPGPRDVSVRFRLAGELSAFCTLSVEAAQRLIAAFKAISGCLPYRKDLVQEGRVPREGIGADVRVSFVPTTLGERVALRLFGRLLSLDELGFEAPLQVRWLEVLRRDAGLVLVSGGSGAGKTTTLYASLAAVARERPGAHLSLEDPVEQRLRVAGIPVDQVELAPERGLTGEAALVAALRQDIDVLGVGEVRTPAEAQLALKAAHTGRLVLAGLHAGSLDEARQRMLDLGVEPRLLDVTLVGALHQRLRTRPCARHVEGASAAASGCPRCHGLGRERAVEAQLWTSPRAGEPA